MSAPLDSRVIRIVRWLLSQDVARSTAELAADLGLSERVVRYRLAAAENFLRSHGAELSRRRGLGLEVEADATLREQILIDISGRSEEPRVYAPDEREHLLLDALLWSYPNTISLDRLNEDLEVSKTSARRDLRRCEPWLERMGLPIVRRPGKGIAILGTEQRVRRAMVQLFLEAVPSDVLDELLVENFDAAKLIHVRVPVGLRDRFASLPVRDSFEAIEASPLHARLTAANSALVFALYLAITEARHSEGRPIQLEPGQFLSLTDHPASDTMRDLITPMSDQGRPELPVEEIAGLTEYMLGLDALAADVAPGEDIEPLVDLVLAIAGQRLHASLSEDEALRRSLSMHMQRLSIRLRYGLPVHNPLLAEVSARYPDVHVVSVEAAGLLEPVLGTSINDDEVGFLTMYLSGAMERAHLRPRKQAMVVCPSGMATAWVLVSRLQAEFPELSLAEVVSASNYQTTNTKAFDIVISTVPLPEVDAPVAVVSPLLSNSDVRTLLELL